jgi:hypothetical protein
MRLPDGRQAPVYMDQSRGGYGFWDSAGKWILIGSILNNFSGHGYQPQYAPGVNPNAPLESGTRQSSSSSRDRDEGGGGGGVALVGLILLVLLIAVGIYVWRMGRAARPGQLANALGKSRITPGGAAGGDPAGAGAGKASALDPWLQLEPGSFVTLSDAQAIADSQERGEGVRGIDYAVEQVGVARDFDNAATWVFAYLYDGHQKLVLMVKGDDSYIEHRVYYASEDFRPAKRENVLRRGDQWLFEAPEDGGQVRPAHLRYAAEIPYAVDGQEVVYVRKDQGERHCEYQEKPSVSGFDSLVATIVEYSTADATENPELLILEIATAKNKTGEVTLYAGAPVRTSEVEIVKAAAVA